MLNLSVWNDLTLNFQFPGVCKNIVNSSLTSPIQLSIWHDEVSAAYLENCTNARYIFSFLGVKKTLFLLISVVHPRVVNHSSTSVQSNPWSTYTNSILNLEKCANMRRIYFKKWDNLAIWTKWVTNWLNWYFIAIPPLKDVFRTTSSGIR